MTDAASIPAVVVTFHPDDALESRLRAIAREAGPVLVVDNSTDPVARGRVADACQRVGAELLANADNTGLGAALNRAFAALRERGFSAVLAFDQDSTPAPGLALALEAVATKHPRCAVVGANWHDEGRPGFASRHLRRSRLGPMLFERIPARADLTDVTCVITSGSRFDLAAWSELGGFDDTLFLDLVDTDYCLRARGAGYDVAVAAAAVLAHRRGAKEEARAFGRRWWPAHMPPRRLRGLFRNRLHVVARHGLSQPHWVLFEAAYTAKILAEIVALEADKGAKLAACAQGTWDGLMGRLGPA